MNNEKCLEIEKKYLFSVEKAPFTLKSLEKSYIEQSYISTIPTIRARKIDEKKILTIKTKNEITKNKNINVDNEIETFLSDVEYNNLLQRKIENSRTVVKNRYYYKLENGFTIEIDEFLNEYEGLYIAEVEFSSIEEAESFVKPKWLGEDVTSNINVKNAVMATIDDVGKVFKSIN